MLLSLKDSLDFFEVVLCMEYLSIISVLPTVDGGYHIPCLEKRQKYQWRKLRNVLVYILAY